MNGMEMIKEHISFHHLGLAVRDFAAAVKFYSALGYKIGETVYDEEQMVELVYCAHQNQPDVELIKPKNGSCSVGNILNKYKETIYHVCYRVNNVEKILEILKQKFSIICVSRPKSAALFGGNPVSFYYIKDVGIIEFIEDKSYKGEQ